MVMMMILMKLLVIAMLKEVHEDWKCVDDVDHGMRFNTCINGM